MTDMNTSHVISTNGHIYVLVGISRRSRLRTGDTQRPSQQMTTLESAPYR